MRICFTRVRSARTKQGLSNWQNRMLMPYFCACGSIMVWQSSVTSPSDMDSKDTGSLPDSIMARSRISLIKFNRYHPAWRIWPVLSFWVGVCGVTSDSINCAKPRIALSGERSS